MKGPGLLREVVDYARHHRKLWLLPVLLIILAIGAVLVIAEGTVISSFIYPLI